MALQVTGNVHTQKGKTLMDRLRAARVSRPLMFGLIRNQEKKLFVFISGDV